MQVPAVLAFYGFAPNFFVALQWVHKRVLLYVMCYISQTAAELQKNPALTALLEGLCLKSIFLLFVLCGIYMWICMLSEEYCRCCC